jgi:hypothetical protein
MGLLIALSAMAGFLDADSMFDLQFHRPSSGECLDIVSLWETEIPFLVSLSSVVIYPSSEELLDLNV